MTQIRLRPATKNDCKQLWEWVNDPEVRANSFSSDPIPWESHCNWFAQKLADPSCQIFIASDQNGIDVGQVRFDRSGEEADVTVSVISSERRKGYATALIVLGVQKLFNETPVALIHAYIKPMNTGSIRSFEKAGFQKSDVKSKKYPAALHYILSRK